MKNVNKDLAKLKNFSVAEIVNGYNLILYAMESLDPSALTIDYDEALLDLQNELMTRSNIDLVEYIISTTK